MSNYEEDFVIINKEDALDETISREFDKEINCNYSEHLTNAFISKDEAIARELQNQIDREYNKNLKRFDTGTSKLIISYEKYRKYDYYLDEYCEEDYDEFDPPDYVDWDRFEAVDVSLNEPKNMKRLMSLPLNIQTGDGTTSHTEISNSVLNRLKLHSQIDTHRENVRYKNKDDIKDRKLDKVTRTCLMGIDQNTNDTIYGLLKGLSPCLQRINGRVTEGNESLIYYGETTPKNLNTYYNDKSNCKCILKLYKIDPPKFIQHEKYIEDDYRYAKRYNSKMNQFNLICLWAEKERDNLHLLKKYIPCPEPIMLKNNVLVMSFIGRKRPAKNLSQVNLSTREYFSAYKQIIENMKIMYQKARLVHAALSESNILWYKQKCYFIDVSKAVDIAHINAFEYLKQDCRYIIDFFDRKKVPDTMTKEELFKYITDQDYNDKIKLELLTLDIKEKRHLKS